MVSCVYSITNIVNGLKYIGSTTDFTRRKYEHLKTLKSHTHRNASLQSDWDLYGRDAFVFETIYAVDKSDAMDLEDLILREADPSAIYNTRKSAYGFELGNTEGCFKRSEETRKKMSEAFKGRKFSETHRKRISDSRTGTRASAETKAKLSLARQRGDHPRARKVFTPDGVFKCQNDAADFYGMSSSWVRRRCKDSKYPEFYLA